MSFFLQDFLKLQQINLAQEISTQLEYRGYNDPSLSQRFIQFCKESTSQQQFIKKCMAHVSSISQHFLSSLYDRIRQKLPNKKQLNQSLQQRKNQNKNNTIINKVNIEKKKQQKIQENFISEEQQQKPHHHVNISTSKQFPGLSLPNNDEIQLQLDLDEGPKQQKQITKKQEIKIEHKRKSRSESSQSRYHKKKKHQRKNFQRQRQRSRSRQRKDKKYKDKYHDNQGKYREKQHYERKQQRQHERHDRDRDYYHHRKQSVEAIQPQQGKVYRGKITRIQQKACFVKLFDVIQKNLGILHATQAKPQNAQSLKDVFRQGQKVWVKILSIMNDRIRLSMKDVDQKTGNQIFKKPTESHFVMSADKKDVTNLTGIKVQGDQQQEQQVGASHGQMWEMSRLRYMGGIIKSRPMVKQDIQETSIEVNDREPPFLRGQTTKAGVNLSPVRIVKNPQGTLQRQALNAAQNARQRRQVRDNQNKQQARDLTEVLDQITPRDQIKKQSFKSLPVSAGIPKQSKYHLPIHNYKQQLIKAVCDNKILIVIGQTGSGKTTQITQFLHQVGFSAKGKIGCTQPRRVAAMSVAKRVCEQMNVKLGEQVGYSIRFQDCTSSKTIIKYMTDGMLLRQALIDKYLTQYSVIMLDEAHQRTIHTDVLFGILKKVVQKRNDFHLIVTSATLQAQKFSTYFFNCKIFSIPGRTYNVEILYAKQPQSDYLDAALMCVMQIHIDEPPGDILLFLTGQQQIDTACQILGERLKKFGSEIPQLIVLPVYSALPSQLQTRIFEPAPKGKRKCVIATNIAEASLTIDGIYYVVDPGFAKIKIFNSKLGMDTLVVAPISQASAKQRAGRAGRTGPGKCYRLYTQQAYKIEMHPTSIPEIQRANLSNIVLELKAMGINDLINFDFMDPPPVQTLIAALQQLYYLSALDDEGLLTKLGKKMAQFPLEPPLSKMLLTSIDLGCSQQIVTIIAMLSVQNVFYRPKQKSTIADQKKTKFNHHEGDHLTYLNVYEAWKKQNCSIPWCHQNFIQIRSLKRAQDIKKQIVQLLARYKYKLVTCRANYSLIRKTIVSGFFFHASRKDSKGGYRTLVDDHQVYIHPSSALFNKQPQWVVYHELIFTTKQYMRDVCSINPKWLIEVAPNFFKFTNQIEFERKKRNQKLDPLNQKYGDNNAWRLSKRKG